MKDRRQLGELKELKELSSLRENTDCGGLCVKDCQGSGSEHLEDGSKEVKMDKVGSFSGAVPTFSSSEDEESVDFYADHKVGCLICCQIDY